MSCLKSLVTLFWLPVVIALSLSACSGGSGGSHDGSQSYSIGGTVTGLTGSVVLQNNGGDDLTVNAEGDFTFATSLNDGGSYSVTVLTQPTGQTCTVSSDSGTVNAADITSVSLFCATNPVLDAEAKPTSVTLSWNDSGATSYNLYYATAPDCDIVNYAGCDGGTMVADVTSPYTVSALSNDQNYWFQLEAVTSGGTAVSNEAGARPAELVANRSVHAIVHDATSGVSYLGGQFTSVGMASGSGVLLSMTTGHPGAFPPVTRSGGNGMVNAVVSDGAGGYYIGGYFDTVDGQARNNLAHILADGTVGPWSPSVSGGAGVVMTMAVSGGTVYVGGFFTAITDSNGTQPRNNLAAIDDSGNVTSWDPDAGSMVIALAVSGSMVYVGGSFFDFGNGATTRYRLAAFDTGSLTPSVPTDWDPYAGSTVYALAVSGSTVYVGGSFTSFGSSAEYPRNHLAAFDTGSLTPSIPTDWDPNASGTVNALAVSGSMVYVGGYFSDFGSGTYLRNNLAAFDTNSLTPSIPTDWDPDADNTVKALTVSGSTVYAGGQFTTIDDGSGAQARNHLAAIGTDGTLSAWNPAPDNTVLALAVSDSTVYAGGSFISTGSEPRYRLAAINADGTLSSTWHPNADNDVYALAVSNDMVYAGGYFTTIDDGHGSGTQARNELAAIGTDGILSTTWHPSANNKVRALAVSNGTVYVGGQFTRIDDGSGDTTRIGLAAIDASTGLLNAWDPRAAGGYIVVYALAVSGSTVYVGGGFDGIAIGSATPLSRSNLAAIDTSGTGTVLDWNPNADNWVYTLAVSGSTVYAGGKFANISIGSGTAQQRKYLAAIGTSGAGTVLDWTPSADNDVSALAVSGSTVYAGGSFTTIDDGSGGTAPTRNHLAAIDATTGLLSSWNPDASGPVVALAVSDSSVYAGGGFTNIEGEYRPNFSVLAPAP